MWAAVPRLFGDDKRCPKCGAEMRYELRPAIVRIKRNGEEEWDEIAILKCPKCGYEKIARDPPLWLWDPWPDCCEEEVS